MLSISDSGAAIPKDGAEQDQGAERPIFNDADSNTVNTNEHKIVKN